MANKLKIGQVNLARSKAATLQLQRVFEIHNFDLILIQEQYTVSGKTVFLGDDIAVIETGACPAAGIAIRNRFLGPLLLNHLSDEYRLCISVRVGGVELVVVSVYLKFCQPAGPHIYGLQTILNDPVLSKSLIIGGDFNARSTTWFDFGNYHRTSRNDAVEEFVVGSGLVLLNSEGQLNTFSGPSGESNIDLTLVSGNLAASASDWFVHDREVLSDHRLISFNLFHAPPVHEPVRSDLWSFRTRSADWRRFGLNLKDALINMEVNIARSDPRVGDLFNDCIVRVSDDCLGRSKPGNKSKTPWWTEEIARLKGVFKRATRRLGASYRNGSPTEITNDLLSQVRAARRAYRSGILKSKFLNWSQWITDVGNADPWSICAVICRNGKGSDRFLNNVVAGGLTTSSVESTLEALLDSLIPQDDTANETPYHAQVRAICRIDPNISDPDVMNVTQEEIAGVINSLGPKKAPGLDRINGVIVKNAWHFASREITNLMRYCLNSGIFPKTWKDGLLRIIPKGNGKPDYDPKAYRPITLLPAFGKVLEKLIRNRMDQCLSPPCARQFGFTRARSTEDAIRLASGWGEDARSKYACCVFLDISGAFDNAWWPMILTKLKARGCPKELFGILRSYLENRSISVVHGSVRVCRTTSMGCPQGSILGPSLWNVVFDDLLRLPFPAGCSCIAYADDALLLLSGNTRRELEIKGSEALSLVLEWGGRNKLTFSPQKTMGLMVKGNLDRGRNPIIRMGGRSVRFVREVKYLGVLLDSNNSFLAHAKSISEKAGSLFMKVRRISTATWGLRGGAVRTLYRGTYVAQLTYAAGVWAHRASSGSVRRTLLSGQRRPLLALTGAYRTVSTAALSVLAGELPADLEVLESTAVKSLKKGEVVEYFGSTFVRVQGECIAPLIRQIKIKSVEIWQSRWDAELTGRWTYAFFPDISLRLKMKQQNHNHYLVQMMSGHGEFGAKLFDLGLVDNAACPCGNPYQTAMHILWECPFLESERDEMLSNLCVVTRPAWCADLVANGTNLGAFSTFASKWVLRWDELRTNRPQRSTLSRRN
jgi:hypothetical protein